MDQQQDLNELPKWPELIDLPDDVREFTANGKVYRVYSSVSIDRWEHYELLQVEAGLGRTFQQFVDTLREGLRLCNEVATGKPVFADLTVLLRDTLVGVTLIDEGRRPAILKMCALFINREGEDIRFIDEGLMESKINDWRQAGISLRFFFRFALRSIPGFYEAFTVLSQGTSTQEESKDSRAPEGTSPSASERSSSATTTSSPPSPVAGRPTPRSGGGVMSSTSSSPSRPSTTT